MQIVNSNYFQRSLTYHSLWRLSLTPQLFVSHVELAVPELCQQLELPQVLSFAKDLQTINVFVFNRNLRCSSRTVAVASQPSVNRWSKQVLESFSQLDHSLKLYSLDPNQSRLKTCPSSTLGLRSKLVQVVNVLHVNQQLLITMYLE